MLEFIRVKNLRVLSILRNRCGQRALGAETLKSWELVTFLKACLRLHIQRYFFPFIEILDMISSLQVLLK